MIEKKYVCIFSCKFDIVDIKKGKITKTATELFITDKFKTFNTGQFKTNPLCLEICFIHGFQMASSQLTIVTI